MPAQKVRLAEYLFERLRQLGLESVHGVPGDYNLRLLDFIVPQGLQWVGNCNELNAGYAADGYARIKGIGSIITTFGVGELSAINAIAGAFAELVPVVHIVGSPARFKQEEHALIHHALGDGDYTHFARMYEHVTVAQTNLLDPRTAPQQIDATLQQCLLHSRPVYIQVPVDMVDVYVNNEQLATPIECPLVVSPDQEDSALKAVLERMYSSRQPMILVDGEAKAFGILDEIEELVKKTNWPTWTSVFGKGLVDETLPNFRGIWKGDSSSPEDASYVRSSDMILCFGPHFSGTNTYQYSAIPNPSLTIHFMVTSTQTKPKQVYRDLPAKYFLSKLLAQCNFSNIQRSSEAHVARERVPTVPTSAADEALTQDLFYGVVGSYLRPGDIILAETGTAGHGCRDFELPRHSHLIKPSTWLSIGYMLPAAQGAALAQHELFAHGKWKGAAETSVPRTVLLIGDGSFQMTAQEISTILRHELNVLIILINNDGYTIERCIHGRAQEYNDVASWRYLQAAAFFGGPSEPTKSGYSSVTGSARTWGELRDALGNTNAKESTFHMLEVFMEREDASVSLLGLLKMQREAGVKNT